MRNLHQVDAEDPAARKHDGRLTAVEVRADGATTPVVFLAEDDNEIRELVASAFRDAGYQVIEARDDGEMLQMIRDAIFDERNLT